jgi:predicted dinucleotide-binding enzyme
MKKGTGSMKIALLGGGHVGAALGIAWAKSGHEVFFGVRDANAADMKETLGACEGRARAGSPAQAVAFGRVVAVALPWPAVDDVLWSLDVAGKIVIDCTNPPTGLHGADGKPLSGAEMIAAKFPQARVAKCFNITGANNMANPVYAEGPATMFVCADDVEAKAASLTLSADAGFETYDLGPLGNARLLESFAQLWIWLAYRGGLGREFAFRLVRREAAK